MSAYSHARAGSGGGMSVAGRPSLAPGRDAPPLPMVPARRGGAVFRPDEHPDDRDRPGGSRRKLKLDEDQKTGSSSWLARARSARDLFQAALRVGGEGNPQALMAAGAQLRLENERAVSKILKPDQKERVTRSCFRSTAHSRSAGPRSARRSVSASRRPKKSSSR